MKVPWHERLKESYAKFSPEEVINWPSLEDLEKEDIIVKLKRSYDGYQRLEIGKFVIENTNPNTWPLIFSLVDFKNTTVLDIGSHYGYYTFKCMEQGAKHSIGVDVGGFTDICREIGWVKKSPAIFLTRNICKDKILFSRDWTLILNVTHHIDSNKDFAYENIFSNTMYCLFEIEKNLLDETEFYSEKHGFSKIYQTNTERNRVLLIYKKLKFKLVNGVRQSNWVQYKEGEPCFFVSINDIPAKEVHGSRFCYSTDSWFIKIETEEKFRSKPDKIFNTRSQCEKELLVWKSVRGTEYEKYVLPILDGKLYDRDSGYAYIIQPNIFDIIFSSWSPWSKYDDLRQEYPLEGKKFLNLSVKQIAEFLEVSEHNVEMIQSFCAKFDLADIDLRRNPCFNVAKTHDGFLVVYDYGG